MNPRERAKQVWTTLSGLTFSDDSEAGIDVIERAIIQALEEAAILADGWIEGATIAKEIRTLLIGNRGKRKPLITTDDCTCCAVACDCGCVTSCPARVLPNHQIWLDDDAP